MWRDVSVSPTTTDDFFFFFFPLGFGGRGDERIGISPALADFFPTANISFPLSLYQIDGQKLDLIYRAGAEDVLLLQFPFFCLSPPTHISRRRIIRLYYIERDEISSLRESMKRNKVRDRENVETTIRRSSLLSRRCPTFSISMFMYK